MWYSEVQHPDGPQIPLKHTLVDDLDGHVTVRQSEKIKVTKTKTGGVDRDSESDHSVVSKSLTTHPSDLSET